LKKKLNKIIYEDNFLSLAGNLINAIFGFAVFALIARSYSISVFGQWVLFISSGTFIEMFRFGITNTAIVRYLSGVGQEERYQFIGSNWLIGLAATIIISIILIGCNIAFADPIRHAGYELFFKWYPFLAFINLPFNTALVIMQADRLFGKIFLIRAINSMGFFLVVLLDFLFLKMKLQQLVWAMLAINGIASAMCMYSGWDGLRYLRKATKRTTRLLLNFGKYTTFTLIGTNLLRSADTLIISLSPLGSAAVALYSVPMKLTELQQIPLRSFVATAFPKMSKASILGKYEEVRDLFYTYSGAISYLFIFISIFTFVFADLFVLILGGKQYLGIDPVTGFNTATIVRIFSVYGLLLPIDRMTGIGLDSINKPNINALKVLYMVVANILGDFIAVFTFRSLNLVAVGSILFTILGVWVGFYYLSKELSLKYFHIFTKGIDFYKSIYLKLKKNEN
jgi:O-antigen/teichoic acid export membrane protein